MELKDLILQTLDEIQSGRDMPASKPLDSKQPQAFWNLSAQDMSASLDSQGGVGYDAGAHDFGANENLAQSNAAQSYVASKSVEALREEREFLEMLEERLLVLFEGLKCEHNQNLQASLNITINFLEYQLSVISERLNDIKK